MNKKKCLLCATASLLCLGAIGAVAANNMLDGNGIFSPVAEDSPLTLTINAGSDLSAGVKTSSAADTITFASDGYSAGTFSKKGAYFTNTKQVTDITNIHINVTSGAVALYIAYDDDASFTEYAYEPNITGEKDVSIILHPRFFKIVSKTDSATISEVKVTFSCNSAYSAGGTDILDDFLSNGDNNYKYFNTGTLSTVETDEDSGDKYLTVPTTATISDTFFKAALSQGYTHFKFHADSVGSEDEATRFCLTTNGGDSGYNWDHYWRDYEIDNDFRIDLTEFYSENGYAKAAFEWRNSSGATATNTERDLSQFEFFKCPETKSWTKSETNNYVAFEHDYLVVETRSNDGYCLSSPEWWKERGGYSSINEVHQATIYHYSEWVRKGDNTRSFLFGPKGAAVSAEADVGFCQMKNIYGDTGSYEEGDKFYIGLDKPGTIKVKLDLLSTYNSYGSHSPSAYTGGNEITMSSTVEGAKLMFAKTKEWVSKGYKSLTVSFASTTADALSGTFWVGDDVWSGGYENGVDASKNYTFDVDLTKDNFVNGTKNVTIQFPTATNVKVTWTPNF